MSKRTVVPMLKDLLEEFDGDRIQLVIGSNRHLLNLRTMEAKDLHPKQLLEFPVRNPQDGLDNSAPESDVRPDRNAREGEPPGDHRQQRPGPEGGRLRSRFGDSAVNQTVLGSNTVSRAAYLKYPTKPPGHVDHLHFTREIFPSGKAGHHLKGIAKDHAVRPVDIMLVELHRLRVLLLWIGEP